MAEVTEPVGLGASLGVVAEHAVRVAGVVAGELLGTPPGRPGGRGLVTLGGDAGQHLTGPGHLGERGGQVTQGAVQPGSHRVQGSAPEVVLSSRG